MLRGSAPLLLGTSRDCQGTAVAGWLCKAARSKRGSSAVHRLAAFVLLGVSLAPTARAQVDTSIVPAKGRTTRAPGLRRPVPARATVCAAVSAASFGNGQVDASSAIQQAIDGCPDGQTVQLSAGTFLVNTPILVNKGITLRGAGPALTKLQKTNGAVWFSYNHAGDPSPVIIHWARTLAEDCRSDERAPVSDGSRRFDVGDGCRRGRLRAGPVGAPGRGRLPHRVMAAASVATGQPRHGLLHLGNGPGRVPEAQSARANRRWVPGITDLLQPRGSPR